MNYGSITVDEQRKVVYIPNTDVTLRSIVEAAELSYIDGRRYYDFVCGTVKIGHISILKTQRVARSGPTNLNSMANWDEPDSVEAKQASARQDAQ